MEPVVALVLQLQQPSLVGSVHASIIQSDISGISAAFAKGRFERECCQLKGHLFPNTDARTRAVVKYPHISSLCFHLSPSSMAPDWSTDCPAVCLSTCGVSMLELGSFLASFCVLLCV